MPPKIERHKPLDVAEKVSTHRGFAMLRVTFVFASLVLVLPTTLPAQNNRWSSAAATRPTPIPLANTPDWLKDYKFRQDKFTFVRIKYNTTRAAKRKPPVPRVDELGN